MDIKVRVEPENWFYSLQELLKIAFPEDNLVQVSAFLPGDCKLDLQFVYLDSGLHARGYIEINGAQQSLFKILPKEKKKNLDKRNARSFVYELLANYLQRELSAYGILTGVRPLKVVHRMIDEGLPKDDILRQLTRDYHLDFDKAKELLAIASYNRQFFLPTSETTRRVSLYIGIPFCPSRCYYCSFPGAILKDYGKEIPAFLEAFYHENESMGNLANTLSYQVENIYLGGGTPAILTAIDLDDLLTHIKRNWNFISEPEITVEAGRPDVITAEKLQIMKQHQINRVCINPQTMHDKTLKRIGRKHRIKDILEVYEMTKTMGFDAVNMDFILGLPQESEADYDETLRQLLLLRPENITLHSLAVKRGSRLAEKEGTSRVHVSAEAVKKGMEKFKRTLTASGYIPYYLYRQKYMKANLENIGFALPGTACRYNVQMMEERQTIIGMGAGASSKFLDIDNGALDVFHNPKDPYFYVKDLERCIQAKVDKLKSLN